MVTWNNGNLPKPLNESHYIATRLEINVSAKDWEKSDNAEHIFQAHLALGQ